jgi:hypothetical protein
MMDKHSNKQHLVAWHRRLRQWCHRLHKGCLKPVREDEEEKDELVPLEVAPKQNVHDARDEREAERNMYISERIREQLRDQVIEAALKVVASHSSQQTSKQNGAATEKEV